MALTPKAYETMIFDLPDGGRRLDMSERKVGGVETVPIARIDFFGKLAELHKTSPTFHRDFVVFVMRAVDPGDEAAMHNINMTLPQDDDGPTLGQTPEDPELSERFSEWVSAFRTLRKRYPSLDEIVKWVCPQGVKDGTANEPDSH
jgi:hypothetical protein